jgi:flagellar protein FlgJ
MNPIDPKIAFTAAQHTKQQERVSSSSKDDKAIEKISAEFEAIMVQSMFKAMRKNVPEGGLFPKSNAEKIYEEMLDMELATQVSQKQSIGLAKQIYEQMQSKLNQEKK